jgi:hypothetical protein
VREDIYQMDEQDIFAAVSKDPAVLVRLVRAAHRMRHEQGHLWEPVPGCGCAEWIDRLLAEYDDEPRAEAKSECVSKCPPEGHYEECELGHGFER